MTDLRDDLERTLSGTYAFERELGGGGMSRVFVAEETALGRKVVVKVLPPNLAATVNVERFKREIQLAAQLQHPHIVPLLSAGIADGLPYYTMPLVTGETLRAKLAREGELPINDTLRILRDIASALACAHESGVVHRDIKPDNVLATRHGALVTDFGVAKALSASTNPGSSLTSLGVALGTPAYMAPEQASADPSTDHRADIYGLGAVAYQMLTGRQVFSDRSPQAMLRAHAVEDPVPVGTHRPSVPPPLAALVMRMLEKHPADRPQSAEEVLRSVEDLITTPSGGMTPTATVPTRAVSGRWPKLRPSRARVAGAIGLLVIAAASAVWLANSTDRPNSQRAGSGRTSGRWSIAVVPFSNMTADRQNEYFSDGLTEELIGALAKLEGLQVAARTSSFALKGSNMRVQAIGESLNVSAVLAGSVRAYGSRARISAQLVDTRDGYNLWSDSYERDLGDPLAAQDQITAAIVGSLKRILGASDRGGVARAGTANPEAYDLYIKGRFAWNQRTRASLVKAERYFREAIVKDSGFARAYVALADVYVVFPEYAQRPWSESEPRALAAVQAALALDSSLAEAHATLGIMKAHNHDFEAAEVAYKKSIALDPSYPTARHWYALHLVRLGRLDEAQVQIREAEVLDPQSRVIPTVHALVFLMRRDYAEAARRLEALLDFDPSFAQGRRLLARIYSFQGKHELALEHSRRVAVDAGSDERGEIGYILARAGRQREATALLDTLLREARQKYVSPTRIAVIYSALGDADRAFEWANRAVSEFDTDIAVLKVDPRFDGLRRDPRYPRLLARMNLTP